MASRYRVVVASPPGASTTSTRGKRMSEMEISVRIIETAEEYMMMFILYSLQCIAKVISVVKV